MNEALRQFAAMAARHADDLTEEDLHHLVEMLPNAEAAKAERVLFLLREQRKAKAALTIALDALAREARADGGNGEN